MTEWFGAVFLVIAFLVLIDIFNLIERGKNVFPIARASLHVIRDPNLSDQAKEKALQIGAKTLFGSFLVLLIGGFSALALPVGGIWIGDYFGLVSYQGVMTIATSDVFIVASSVIIVVGMVLVSRVKKSSNSYSWLDRLLHRIAFKTYVAQVSIADVETKLIAKKISTINTDRPVFVTALPRAGTTLLLECFANLPEFASLGYRDMPFVMTPVLWSRFSSRFHQDTSLRERAHGDGMMINVESPEALEEILWKTFWPSQYLEDRIRPWKDKPHKEFEVFIRNHMRKIGLVRRGDDAPDTRYVSKNNPNISRVDWLRKRFPNAAIVIPFRDPLQHAASLLKQHKNFLQIQREDPFASEYMRGIGHFDFGENLRPIDFDGWLDRRHGENSEDLHFWLEYWVASYRYLVRRANLDIRFFDYEALCDAPQDGLQALGEAVGVRDKDILLTAAETIHAVTPRETDTSALPKSLLDDAKNLHMQLKTLSTN